MACGDCALARKARKQALITDQGLDQGQAVKPNRPWARPRREVIWRMHKRAQANLGQNPAQRQILAKRHQPELVINPGDL